MSLAIIWILVGISNGVYNQGSIAQVAKYSTENECLLAKEELGKQSYYTKFICVPADRSLNK